MLIEKLLKVALLGSSWVMYLMLMLSVLSISAMVERVVFFRRRSQDIEAFGDQLAALIGRRDYRGAAELAGRGPSVEAQIMARALRFVTGGPDALEDAVQSELSRSRSETERGTVLLGTLGNNAPFIGLFGTIIGVIISFHQLGANQATAAMGAVMGGIAEALVATGVGLFVAIPAVVAYNLVQKRVGEVENNVASITKLITALLKAQAAGWQVSDAEPSVPPSDVSKN
jgi:biopolymer transport protein ExbB/TolQ